MNASSPWRTLHLAGHLALTGLLLLVGLLSSACIKREPLAPAPVTESTKADPTTEALPPAKRPATGLWGQVPSVDVLGGQGLRAFAVSGNASALEARWLPVTDQPFNEKIQTKLLAPTKNAWDVQIRASNQTGVKRGDVLLASLQFRTEWVGDESGEGQTEAVFELAQDPWTKSVTAPVRGGPEWKLLQIPFVAESDYAPGEAQFAFRMGYPQQTLELADIKLENFGQKLALADLPRTRRSYPGAAPDAPWRAEAAARIEQHRKGDLRVLIVDAAGTPISGAQVSAKLARHAFNFGTAAPADLLVGDKNPKFKQVLLDHFNTVTIENNLKWQPLAGDWGPSFTLDRAQAAAKWLHEHDLNLRGHVLVWPGWPDLPAFLKKHEKDPAMLRKLTNEHIVEVAGAMKGQVIDWDVVNEPFTRFDLLEILGYDVMVDWFKLARQTDPKAKLYINDFAILNGGASNTAHRDHYEKMIKLLVDKGAELDGIGFQGHFGQSLTGPTDVYRLLERYGKYGKRMAITEYDILEEDEELCADYTRDFYTILFSHPQVDSIIMWGFWDPRHWKKNAVMYREDWSEKPAGKAYRDLVEREWRTHVAGATNAEGTYELRGFLGEYDVSVTVGGRSVTAKAQLAKTAPGQPQQLLVRL